MSKKNKFKEIQLEIFGLNERGYGLAKDENKKVYEILNALPGEKVIAKVELRRKKSKGQAIKILQQSKYRIEPKDPDFTSTSPLQILDLKEENRLKKKFIKSFYKEFSNVDLQDFEIISAKSPGNYNYRNKVEFSFYGENETEKISLAFFKRGTSKGKLPTTRSSLVPKIINQKAGELINILNQSQLKSRNLKSVIFRYSFFEKKLIMSLFVKNRDLGFDFNTLEILLDDSLVGVGVYYSNPLSPAAVITEIIIEFGTLELIEKINDKKFVYNHKQFFQINPKIFSFLITDIRQYLNNQKFNFTKALDLYSGVGTIGISLADFCDQLIFVELSEESNIYAAKNFRLNNQNNISKTEFIQAEAEKSLEYLDNLDLLIVDPPRSGLHPKVIDKIKETKPKTIIYVSCNPKTQAENYNQLKNIYKINFYRAYNLYPKTPHVEGLGIWQR